MQYLEMKEVKFKSTLLMAETSISSSLNENGCECDLGFTTFNLHTIQVSSV